MGRGQRVGRTYNGLILAELIDGGRRRETDREGQASAVNHHSKHGLNAHTTCIKVDQTQVLSIYWVSCKHFVLTHRECHLKHCSKDKIKLFWLHRFQEWHEDSSFTVLWVYHSIYHVQIHTSQKTMNLAVLNNNHLIKIKNIGWSLDLSWSV